MRDEVMRRMIEELRWLRLAQMNIIVTKIERGDLFSEVVSHIRFVFMKGLCQPL
jgi:hypothetical protein